MHSRVFCTTVARDHNYQALAIRVKTVCVYILFFCHMHSLLLLVSTATDSTPPVPLTCILVAHNPSLVWSLCPLAVHTTRTDHLYSLWSIVSFRIAVATGLCLDSALRVSKLMISLKYFLKDWMVGYLPPYAPLFRHLQIDHVTFAKVVHCSSEKWSNYRLETLY